LGFRGSRVLVEGAVLKYGEGWKFVFIREG
jgi:hypothetical protein